MSENMEDGGPAFPVHGGYPGDDPRNQIMGGGLSIRDWFAGQALEQSILDYDRTTRKGAHENGPVLPYAAKAIGSREDIIARQAYRYADAMLTARKMSTGQ